MTRVEQRPLDLRERRAPSGARELEWGRGRAPGIYTVLMLQTVGYPAESWEAGGQRPRRPFEDLFSVNTYGTPFPRSDDVVEELTADGIFTAPAPLPWREAELEYLRRALQLEDRGSGLL